MEIGDQQIGGFEAVSGSDEDRCVTAEGVYAAGVVRRALQQPERGGAGGNDASTAAADAVKARGRFGGDLTPFGVHAVIGGILGLYGEKGTLADMEGKIGGFDTSGFKLGDQRICEVQACGRRGDGARLAGEYGLIVGP